MYRIPKHVNTRFRWWKLDIRGMIIEGVNLAVVLLCLRIWPPQGMQDIVHRLLAVFFQLFVPWLFLSQDELVDAIRTTIYHSKNAAVLRWESEPNAIPKIEEKE